MKNKFLIVAILLVFYYSSKITAMENTNLSLAINKDQILLFQKNNLTMRKEIDYYENTKYKYFKSNINFTKALTTDDLDNKFIQKILPCFFTIHNNDGNNISILIPEPIIYSTFIYAPEQNRQNKIAIENISDDINKFSTIKILLEKKFIECHIRNSITILEKKGLLRGNSIFNIENLYNKMFSDPSLALKEYLFSEKKDAEIANETLETNINKNYLIRNRIYYIFYIISILNKLKINILKCNATEKILEYCNNEKNGITNIADSKKQNEKIINLEINGPLFQSFLYPDKLINMILLLKDTYPELTPTENYIMHVISIDNSLNKPIQQSKEQLTHETIVIDNNNNILRKETMQALVLLNTISKIKFAFSAGRENDGDEPEKFDTYSSASIPITKDLNNQFLIPFLDSFQAGGVNNPTNNLNNKPEIPYFQFFNKNSNHIKINQDLEGLD